MAKLLLVDDDRDMLLVLQHAMKLKGHEVESLEDPRTFMDTLTRFQPDLAVLDIDMGGCDGRTLCRIIKQSVAHQHVLVVLFSGLSQGLGATEDCAADLFIQKPSAVEHLLGKIDALLAGA